jgi:hypothetical protein
MQTEIVAKDGSRERKAEKANDVREEFGWSRNQPLKLAAAAIESFLLLAIDL